MFHINLRKLLQDEANRVISNLRGLSAVEHELQNFSFEFNLLFFIKFQKIYLKEN